MAGVKFREVEGLFFGGLFGADDVEEGELTGVAFVLAVGFDAQGSDGDGVGVFGLHVDAVFASGFDFLELEGDVLAGGGDVFQVDGIGAGDGDVDGFCCGRFAENPLNGFGLDVDDDGNVDDGGEGLLGLLGIVGADAQGFFVDADKGADFEFSGAVAFFARLVGGFVHAGFEAGAIAVEAGDGDGFVAAVVEGEFGLDHFVGGTGFEFEWVFVEDESGVKGGRDEP